tara:strand:- start:1216 stop:4014 length:2799 start_codon:yes stop_codon:yes gene_type:complete
MARTNTITFLEGDTAGGTVPSLSVGEPVWDDQDGGLYVGTGSSNTKKFIGGGYGGTWASGTTLKPHLILENTNTDAYSSRLTFKQTNASAAADDEIGLISFLGEDAGDADTEYARIKATSTAVTEGSESGKLFFGVATTGTGAYADVLTIAGGAAAASSTVAAAGHLTVAGNATITGDLEVTGDDLTMGTNTSGHMLIADGTNFNPVAMSGDATIDNAGALTIANNSVTGAMIALGSDAAGDVMYYNGTDYVRLAKGTAGQVLTINSGATAPEWDDAASGDITGVDLTGGTNINISGETNTTSGAYSSTINLDSSPTLTSSSASQPVLTLENNANDTTGGSIKFIKDKGGAGADGDDIGSILFSGDDSGETETDFAKILAEVGEADNTDEAGKLTLSVASSNGTTTGLEAGLVLTGHKTGDYVDVTLGTGANSTVTIPGDLQVTGATTTVNTTDVSIADVAMTLAVSGGLTNQGADKEDITFSVANGGTVATFTHNTHGFNNSEFIYIQDAHATYLPDGMYKIQSQADANTYTVVAQSSNSTGGAVTGTAGVAVTNYNSDNSFSQGAGIQVPAGGGDVAYKANNSIAFDYSNDEWDVTAGLNVDGHITGSGVGTFASLDISGNIDVDGTTNLDAVDIDGAVDLDNTLTVGQNDTGYDVKFFGATSGAYMLWDESADDLILAGAAGLDVDGTTNLDAVDIDGAVQLDNTLTVGVNDTGYDVKFFGATSGAYMLWDESTDDLKLAGAAGLDVDGQTDLDVTNIVGALTVGVDDTGHDVKFFGATTGQYMLWDESADELVLAGDSKLSFHDAAGGENIIASSDGHLEINSGTTIDMTATTIQLNGNADINGDADVSGTLTVGTFAPVNFSATGNVDLGDATSDTITCTGRFDSDLVPSTDSARDLGTTTLQWAEAHIDTGYIDTISGATIAGGTF